MHFVIPTASLTTHQSPGELERRLDPRHFFRIIRNALVNLDDWNIRAGRAADSGESKRGRPKFGGRAVSPGSPSHSGVRASPSGSTGLRG